MGNILQRNALRCGRPTCYCLDLKLPKREKLKKLEACKKTFDELNSLIIKYSPPVETPESTDTQPNEEKPLSEKNIKDVEEYEDHYLRRFVKKAP